MSSWDNLSIKEKADVMRVAIDNGITNLSDIKNQYNSFADGGNIYDGTTEDSQQMRRPITTGGAGYIPPSKTPVNINKVSVENNDIDLYTAALNRANSVYNNYSDAKDFNMNPLIYGARKVLNSLGLPSGMSNCTLSATQWIDPSNPIKSASTIFDSSNNTGYTRIKEEDALPGDLLITKNPKVGSYHTMFIEGYDDNNKPILRYSTGGSDNDSLRTGISLDKYHKLDKEQGGNHTEDYYFRYNNPNTTYLSPLVVSVNKKKYGGSLVEKVNYGEYN